MKTTTIIGSVAIGLSLLIAGADSHASTVAYWRFEPGNFTADSSGNGHTLVNSGVTSSSDIAFNLNAPGAGSASFDNASWLNTASSLNLTPYTQLTVEWFQKTSSTAGDAVLTHSNGSLYAAPNGGFLFYLNDVPGSISAIEERNSGTSINYAYTPFTPAQWDHFAVTMDGTQTGTNRFKLYKNYQQTFTYLASTPLSIPFINETFYFGRIGGSGGEFYTGLLDEVRISDQILAPSEFIPEPSSGALAAIGLVVMASRRNRRG